MNKIALLLFVLSIILISCDGRERAHKNNKDTLLESKLLDSFSENIKYFPEQYSETETDTILSNGFRVKIKLYSDMDNVVLNMFKKDNITHKHYYRDSIANVIVLKNNIEVFNKTINKSFLATNSNQSKHVLEKATINDIWLNQLYSIESNDKIKIDVSFNSIGKRSNSIYQIYIDNKGMYSIKEHLEETI